jgi:PAS domain S-box-containing protein
MMRDTGKALDQLRAKVEVLHQQVAMLRGLVAERWQLTEMSQASETGYRTLVEHLNDVLYSLSSNGEILYINPAVKRLSGHEPAELIGHSFHEFIHPDDLPTLVERVKRAVAGDPQPYEYRIITKGGETRWVRGFSCLSTDGAQGVRLNGVLVDIDERKKAEEALQASEEKYRGLYNSLLDGVVRASPDDRIIECNQAFADMLGYAQEELRGRHCQDLTPARWHAFEAQILTEQVLSRGYSDEYEKEFIRKDGALVPVSVKIWRTVNTRGEVDGLWGIVRNLTATKQAEREREALYQLAHSLARATDLQSAAEALFQQIRACFGATYGSITLIDAAGEVLHEVAAFGLAEAGAPRLAQRRVQRETSPSTMAFLTRQPVIIENFPHSPHVSPWLREQYHFMRDVWVVPLMGGEQAIGTLLLGFAARREATAADLRLLQLLGDEAALALQRARFAEEVQQTHARYETLLNSIDGIVWEVDVRTFQFTFVSRQAEQLLGYPVEQWLTEPDFWENHLHPEDREWAVNFCLTSTQQKQPHQFNYRMLAADGRVVWLRDQVTVVVENDQPVALRGIMTDITDRVRAEEERRQLQAQLFQSQKLEAIGTLAGGVAHDFNNILTAIMGFAELTLDEIAAGTEAYENLRAILLASHRAKTLVRQLLDFSRRRTPEWQMVDLPSLIQDTLQLLRAMVLPTIQLSARLDRQAGAVWGDPAQLQQVLMNLCVNAVHAIGERGGKIEIDLQEVNRNDVGTPLANLPDPSLRLTVRDTGCGMTPEVLERIFEPFFTTKPVGEGSGLGLAVVHGIVANHGGTITVESQPGKGTVVHIYLPGLVQEPDARSADTHPSVV